MSTLAYQLDFSPVLKQLPRFLNGALITLLFGVVTILGGTILGFIINLGSLSKHKWLRALTAFYISIFRGTPSLIQLYICFYGIPLVLGFTVNPFAAGMVALSLNSSAYVAEIFRSGIQAVDIGQSEAARSLGLSKRYTMIHVIFPQAFRNILPAIGNEFITLIKESSIVSLIGISDITHISDLVKASTYKVFESLIVAALIYFIITTSLTFLIRLLEKKLSHGKRKKSIKQISGSSTMLIDASENEEEELKIKHHQEEE